MCSAILPALMAVMTMAGRTLRISSPSLGSKRTSHTSPRWMLRSVIQVFFRVRFKHLERFVGGLGKLRLQNGIPFFNRQAHQFTRCIVLLLGSYLLYEGQDALLLCRFQTTDFFQNLLVYCVHELLSPLSPTPTKIILASQRRL